MTRTVAVDPPDGLGWMVRIRRSLASLLAKFGTPPCYIIAYGVTLTCFVIVWFRHRTLLYMGRDAQLSLWLHKAYLDWAHSFDVTAMNPMQGMTSMLVAMNPYFNPGAWIFQTELPEMLKLVASFVVYFLEVTLSTVALGVALGFSRPFSFVASLWLAFLLFPPFNFVYGLQGWLATSPTYGHTLTLSNLIIIAFLKIGDTSPGNSGFVGLLARNWLLATCIFLLVVLIVLAAPFYNGGLLIGTFLLGGAIFLASTSYRAAFWRLGAGVYVLSCCAALHFFEFFAGARAYSARFSAAEISVLQLLAAGDSSSSLITNARNLLCGWGIFCDRLAAWPGALTGSYWLQVSIILGGIAVALRMPTPLARIGAVFTTLWVVLLLVWIGASLGLIVQPPFAPIYFYLMMYPFWAFFSLYAGVTLIDLIKVRVAPRAPPVRHQWMPAGLCVGALALLPLFHASPSHVLRWHSPSVRIETPLIEILRKEISLRPGQAYRGSVATLLGSAGSPLRKLLLENDQQPLKPFDFEKFFRKLILDTGSTHDLLDLWWQDIPTLSEYGQGRSKALMFYVWNIFNAPTDPKDYNFAFPRVANIDILRALGVRFIITDLELPSNNTRVRRIVPLKDDINLYLYELSGPNLGGFSPRKVSVQISPSELLERIRLGPALLESEAFASSSVAEKLVSAERAQMIFERGAVHVTASSPGTSALLLPVQFSHCFRLEPAQGVRMLRANLIHTLLIFSGELDVRLKWEFSFWRNSDCRRQDADDARALGLS